MLGGEMSKYFDFLNDTIDSKSVVFDLGCGNGKFSPIEKIDSKPNIVIGLDVDEELLRENTYLKSRVLGDAHKLPFRQNSFDVIITRAVMEHLENPDIMLSEASKVLKPEGTIIIQTPNKRSPIGFLSSMLSLKGRALFKRIFTHEDKLEGNYETYYRCNTGRRLSNTLNKNGFSEIKIVYEDIGLKWVRNPLIRAALSAFQKITNLSRILFCFKQHLICIAKNSAK